MKNVYDGVVTLDKKCEAEVDLPNWFDVLNNEYRYNLTVMGAPGPTIYIAKEIPETRTDYTNPDDKSIQHHSSFRIADGITGMRVSLQATVIRKDP
jgi:hypothetical protein